MSEALSSSPSPRRGQEGLQRGLLAGGDGGRAGARVALGVEQHLVERAGLQDLALLGGGRAEQRGVDPRQRIGHRLALGPVDERRELDQLQVAHGAVGDVEVGVQAQLAQAPAGARDRAQQLVAQRGEGGVQRLVGAEELLGALLPRRRPARRAPPPGRARGAAARRRPSARRSRGRAPRARGSSPTCSSRRMSATCSARVSAASSSCSSASGIGSASAPARAGHARGLQAEDEDVAELAPLRGVHRHDADGAVAALAGALLVVVQARLGHRRHVAGEVAPGRLRRAAHVGGGQVAQARERRRAARRRRPGRRRAAGGAARGGR